VLEWYNVPNRPRDDELLRELDGRGDDSRLGRSWISASAVIRDGLWNCCVGLVAETLGDPEVDGTQESPTYEGEWLCRELL
jgi:hypothetical protein